ncbi:MAG: hypothetical protein NVSMB22_06060 [Chloroflexota bacterium]
MVLPVLLGAAVLRFHALPLRGLVYWDEAKFALEGMRLSSMLASVVDPHTALAGKAVGTAKPTHALLIAIGYLLLGVHDYTPLLLNATASVLQVGLVFVWGRRLAGTWTGLVASIFLAISGYDIVYARSALSESDANLFFVAGALVWWSMAETNRARAAGARIRWLPHLTAGLLMGAALTANYRLVIYIATFVACDLFVTLRQSGRRDATIVTASGLAGLAILPLAWHVVGMVSEAHGVVLFQGEIVYRPTSYLGELMYQVHGGKQAVFRFNPQLYLQWYVIRQGWPLSILLLVGLGRAAVERSNALLLPAALVIVPFGAYMFAPFIVPRNLDAALPFTVLMSAAALAPLRSRVRHVGLRSMVLSGAVLALALFEAVRVWPLTGVRSGFALAAQYVQRQHAGGAFVVSEVMRFYLRDGGRACHAPELPSTTALVTAGTAIGETFAVIDDFSRPSARYLERHASLVARYPAINVMPMGENLIASENGLPPLTHPIKRIDIYALDSLTPRVSPSAHPPSCSLDRLA